MIEHMVDKRISMADSILSTLKQINLIENPEGEGRKRISIFIEFRIRFTGIPSEPATDTRSVKSCSSKCWEW